MSPRSLVPIWTPEDTREVLERAARHTVVEAVTAQVIDINTGEVLA